MPEMPKQPCAGKCGRLVESGRCPACSGRDARPSAAKRMYDGHWRKTRVGYLAKHPLCADPEGMHRRDGVVVPATELDHIVPHKGDKNMFWTRSNWQGLCKSCHSRKTASEGGFGRFPQ